MSFLFSFLASTASAEVVLGPGETIDIGGETVVCSSDNPDSQSTVDLDCVKYLHETNNDNVPPIDLLRDWVDSCRSIPIRNPLTPKTCTVVGGKINRECLTYVRSLYPGVNSEIVMELQLECKDLVLKCSSF